MREAANSRQMDADSVLLKQALAGEPAQGRTPGPPYDTLES